MCTMIVEQADISGSGKGPKGWFHVDRVNVMFDHPFNLPVDHALSIDFVDASAGARGARGRGVDRRVRARARARAARRDRTRRARTG